MPELQHEGVNTDGFSHQTVVRVGFCTGCYCGRQWDLAIQR